MLRKYRVAISLVVLIAALLGVYQLFWVPYRQSRALIETDPLIPDLSSVVPNPSGPAPTTAPNIPHSTTQSPPDGRYAFYLGISSNDLVTIYRWVEGNLVVVQELNQLPVDKLRSEDKDELSHFIGANTEEEIWQRVEGLTH